MLPQVGVRPFSVVFDDTLSVGDGKSENFSGPTSLLNVGVNGLFEDRSSSFSKIDSLKFTRTVVALFHEYGHYLQNYRSDKNVACMISELSVVGNDDYYIDSWKSLPHEISAEATGVSMAWDAMSNVFPDAADACMLAYVNFRAGLKSYMLPYRVDGYSSKDEVMRAFEESMQTALYEPRLEKGGFFASKTDESVCLLQQGFSSWARSPNAYHADKLLDKVSGSKRDRMMAALVLQLHPDLLDDWPELRGEDLTVEHEFGKPLAVCTLPGGPPPGKYTPAMTAMMRSAERTRNGDAAAIGSNFDDLSHP